MAVVRPARANSQFRVIVDTNNYSVPAEYAGAAVTLGLYPGHVCIYHQNKLIARHVRSYDRHQDIEHPDHPKALLQQRRRAGEQKLLQRLLALSPRAEPFYQAMAERRLNPAHHVRKIVALSEIYGPDATARAIDDALEFGAFSCEYIANILEQRQRVLPEPGALHVTRRQDLLELELPEPDMALYDDGTSALAPVEKDKAEGPVPSGVEGQPTQMTLDFETAPDPNMPPKCKCESPNVNPDPDTGATHEPK